MKFVEEAKTIVKLVGGEKNINNLVHCATRLRFELKNEAKADKEALESLPYESHCKWRTISGSDWTGCK